MDNIKKPILRYDTKLCHKQETAAVLLN